MIDEMPLYLPGSSGKAKPSSVIPKNTPQKSTMYWHAHQADLGISGKSAVVTEAVTLEGLRRSLKTANQAKRSKEDTLDKIPSPIKISGVSSKKVNQSEKSPGDGIKLDKIEGPSPLQSKTNKKRYREHNIEH